MTLSIEVVTPHGVAFEAADLDRVVLRRDEPRFDVGSQIVVLPRHGEMLVRLPTHAIELFSEGDSEVIEVEGGFAEVYHDHIIVLAREAHPADQSDPSRRLRACS